MEINRPLTTSTEENIRFTTFNERIFTLLEDYQQDSKTYTVGLNQFGDRTQKQLTLEGNRTRSKASSLPASVVFTALIVDGTNTRM